MLRRRCKSLRSAKRNLKRVVNYNVSEEILDIYRGKHKIWGGRETMKGIDELLCYFSILLHFSLMFSNCFFICLLFRAVLFSFLTFADPTFSLFMGSLVLLSPSTSLRFFQTFDPFPTHESPFFKTIFTLLPIFFQPHSSYIAFSIPSRVIHFLSCFFWAKVFGVLVHISNRLRPIPCFPFYNLFHFVFFPGLLRSLPYHFMLNGQPCLDLLRYFCNFHSPPPFSALSQFSRVLFRLLRHLFMHCSLI